MLTHVGYGWYEFYTRERAAIRASSRGSSSDQHEHHPRARHLHALGRFVEKSNGKVRYLDVYPSLPAYNFNYRSVLCVNFDFSVLTYRCSQKTENYTVAIQQHTAVTVQDTLVEEKSKNHKTFELTKRLNDTVFKNWN